MTATLGRVILYSPKMDDMVAFYTRHFGFSVKPGQGDDRLVELVAPEGGAVILLHPASQGQKQGQVQAKLVFDVPDVPAFCDRAAQDGLRFGPLHRADGYCFANAKDPSGNAIQVSSRAFAKG
ncbi:VOC family protein [Roseibaca sp. Y0-43]|uniref:VOC family protein n=1 Tax=Roseibaca sp. Y0-43 TaxID=2816854 RepID=UPI001D0C0A50|nr:VOC family protein [Roseibaca sp. Y0-43]MCC1481844.1 VOC family protein [Roseibaca sp. Y0-43]